MQTLAEIKEINVVMAIETRIHRNGGSEQDYRPSLEKAEDDQLAEDGEEMYRAASKEFAEIHARRKARWLDAT